MAPVTPQEISQNTDMITTFTPVVQEANALQFFTLPSHENFIKQYLELVLPLVLYNTDNGLELEVDSKVILLTTLTSVPEQDIFNATGSQTNDVVLKHSEGYGTD